MFPPTSPESHNSDLFYVEQSSIDPSPSRPNTPIAPNSTEMSGNDTREMISISSIASPGPQILTNSSDSNESTMPYEFGRQLPVIPTNLNDLNLPPNPFNLLATMAVANPTEEGRDETYSPHSPEPLEPSPTSTPPMTLSTIEGWEKPHTMTDDNTFYSNAQPRRICFLPSIPSPSPPLRSFGLSLECPSQNEGECRSKSVRAVDICSLRRRTNQARRQQPIDSRMKTSLFFINCIQMIRSSYVSNLCTYM